MVQEEQIREDLLRYMDDYGWEPRITTKLLNLRHGTDYTAEEIKTLHSCLHHKTVDPATHLQNLDDRRSPALTMDEPQ